MGGPYLSVKPMNNGKQLFVHFGKKIYSDKLLYRTKELNDLPVKVTPHRTLNYSRCAIWSKELANMDKEDIQKELKSQGVTKVERMKRQKDGRLIPADSYILTINGQEIPKKSKLAFSFEAQKFTYQISNDASIVKSMATTKNSAKMCKMRTDRSWGSRLWKWNEMCQLRWWSLRIHKKLPQIENWKGNPQKKISKHHIFSWSQTTSWRTCNWSIQKFIC